MRLRRTGEACPRAVGRPLVNRHRRSKVFALQSPRSFDGSALSVPQLRGVRALAQLAALAQEAEAKQNMPGAQEPVISDLDQEVMDGILKRFLNPKKKDKDKKNLSYRGEPMAILSVVEFQIFARNDLHCIEFSANSIREAHFCTIGTMS
jgi:hypothetical protein